MTTLAERVASRYVRATRPIHLDKKDIASFVEHAILPEFIRWARRQPQDIPMGDSHGGIAHEWYTVEASDGRSSVRVEVILRTVHTNAKGVTVMGGGFGTKEKDPVIIIDLNGAFTPAEMLSERAMQPIHACTYHTCLPHSIFSVLIHEFTHASESVFPSPPSAKGDGNKIPDEGGAEYVNNPAEVRAFMQEIVDDAVRSAKIDALRNHAQKDPNPNRKLIDTVLVLSRTWGLIQKTLTPSNRAKILKAVYDALDRNELLLQ